MPLPLVIIGLVAGPALLAFALTFRLGRSQMSRAWVHGDDDHQQRVLLALPGGACLLLACGLTPWIERGVPAVLFFLLLFTGLAMTFSATFGPRVPRWFTPRWARQPSARKEGDA